MLSRSVRRQRRHTSNILAASFAQLHLPWLAPAQLRWSASHAAAVASPHINTRPRRRSASKVTQQAKAQIRQLATATDTASNLSDALYDPASVGAHTFRNAAQDQSIPWDFSKDAKTKYSALRPYSDPIILNRTTEAAAEFRRLTAGATGTTVDLLHLLYTTLRVGRITRAEDIIHRLTDSLCNSAAPEVIHAHGIYLEEMLRVLVLAGSGTEKGVETMKHVQRWFEVEIIQRGAVPDTKILVIMVKAAVCGSKGLQRDRAIRRYAEMARAQGEDELDEVLYSELYDDNEFTIIGAATSEYYEEPEEEHLRLQLTESPNIDEIAKEHNPVISRPDTIRLEDIPGVRPTEQKGAGLSTIQRSLEAFSSLPALTTDATPEAQRARAYERERLMEETAVEIALDRWRKEDEDLKKVGVSTSMQSKPVGALMYEWYKALLPVLQNEKEECRKVLENPGNENDRLTYGPYLETLPAHKLAASTILSVLNTFTGGKDTNTDCFEYERKLSAIITAVAQAVEMESNMEVFRRATGKRNIKARSEQALKHFMARQRREQKKENRTGLHAPPSTPAANAAVDMSAADWPMHVKVKIGAMLFGKLMATAQIPAVREHPQTKEKLTSMQPAFMHRPKYVRGKRHGMIVPNLAVIKKLEMEPTGAMIVKRMPMIVEPLPWTGIREGGYIHYPTNVLRQAMGDKSGQDYFKAAHANGDLNQLYAGLTALGRVPWKVHHGVLKTQVEAWNSGESIGNFAPLNPVMNIPPEPDSTKDPGLRQKWLRAVQTEDSKRAGLHSKRCFQNFQLEIARGLANETLYFPHSLDFRGRAYPVPPYLNHMGADNVRGLLVFAEGKALGETGLRWLKIHLANVFGYDKASLQEREDFTMEHLDDVYDSVRNPLGGRKWWLKSEDAWQTLAACHEVVAALDSPDPTKFVSHLPIQQDGTCNGLQHYAALGGDEAGAAQVNLEPSDRPADVYTGVLNAVNERVDKDAAEGHAIAKRLQGRLKRKVVKRPVMTNVYGVTFHGARSQVRKEIEEQYPDIKPLDEINPHSAAQYVTKQIFESLGEMFKGAQAIQHWFGKCADRILTGISPEQVAKMHASSEEVAVRTGRIGPTASQRKALTKKTVAGTSTANTQMWNRSKPLFKSPIVWTTPLRLPVAQPYRTSSARIIKTNMQNISLQEPQIWDPVNKRKQLQAFPPNFVHSLDATHMLISALKCNELGMAFASIHDSFWTHACDINAMNGVLRDAFVAMHSEDIIGRLREEFETRYKGYMYLASVAALSPAGKAISKIRRESKTSSHSNELQIEVERLRLLKSEDPAERKKGEDMVTPGSSLANEMDESAFLVPAEMAGQTLGEVPSTASNEESASESDTLSAPEIFEDGEEIVDQEVPAALREEPEGDYQAGKPDEDEGSEDRSWSEKRSKDKKRAADHKRRNPRKLYVWMPLRFPEVPKKGTFDVRRLKESKYFFH